MPKVECGVQDLEYRIVFDHNDQPQGVEDYKGKQSLVWLPNTDTFTDTYYVCNALLFNQICTPLVQYYGNLFRFDGACEILTLQKPRQAVSKQIRFVHDRSTFPFSKLSWVIISCSEDRFHWNGLGYAYTVEMLDGILRYEIDRLYPQQELQWDDMQTLVDTAKELQQELNKEGIKGVEIYIDDFLLENFGQDEIILPEDYNLPVAAE